MFKSLLKIKAVAASGNLPEVVRKPVAQGWGPAVLNVHGRLCNSNPVKEVMPQALEDVQRALGLEVIRGVGKGKRVRAKDFEGEKARKADVDEEVQEGRRGDVRLRKRVKEELDDETPEGQMNGNMESDSDGSAMFADFDDRLGSSDDGEGDGEGDNENDVDDLEKQLEMEGIRQGARSRQKPSKYDLEADLSMSDAASDSESESPEPRKGPPPKKTTFLPSLSMGGYVSGSGSDLEDDIDVAPKKNRRGQRARQQIWEKKFGAKAKHVQNGQGKQDRNQGWDAKRGATEGRDNGRSRGRGGGRGAKFGVRGDRGATGSNGVGVSDRKPPPKKDDSGPLHPSWEAAKKAKEAKSKPVTFTGKKVTFD